MLVRVLLAAILAGVAGGVFATAAQALRVTPIIIEAESYENAGAPAAHDHAAAPQSTAPAGHDHAAAHDHGDEDEWAPADGFERTFYTLVANMAVGVGFALIVTAAVLVTGVAITPLSGLVWGLAGFIVFVLAPNLGLPPELPGMAAADLGQRQAWWLATVICTGAGLWIFAFRRHIAWMVGGAVLIAAPHIWGAPKPESHESLPPAHLAVDFVTATIATSFVYWLFLGAVLGFLIDRAMRAEARAA